MDSDITEQEAVELGLLDPPEVDAHVGDWLKVRAETLAEQIAADSDDWSRACKGGRHAWCLPGDPPVCPCLCHQYAAGRIDHLIPRHRQTSQEADHG